MKKRRFSCWSEWRNKPYRRCLLSGVLYWVVYCVYHNVVIVVVPLAYFTFFLMMSSIVCFRVSVKFYLLDFFCLLLLLLRSFFTVLLRVGRFFYFILRWWLYWIVDCGFQLNFIYWLKSFCIFRLVIYFLMLKFINSWFCDAQEL